MPAQVAHVIDQKKAGYRQHVQDLAEGDIMLHQYNKKEDMKAKWTDQNRRVVDDQGEIIEMKDTKEPSKEEMAQYQIKSVEISSYSQSAEFDSFYSSGRTNQRRITFARTESEGLFDKEFMEENLDPDDIKMLKYDKKRGKLILPQKIIPDSYKEAAKDKPKKKVRVFPVVRITVVDNYANYDVDDIDLLTKEEITRGLRPSDLWYGRADIRSFRRLVREENAVHHIERLRQASKHSLMWFQTFGKFHSECGEDFSPEHEVQMFGKILSDNIDDLEEDFYDDTLKLMAEHEPIEYAAWEDGLYFTEDRHHSSFVYSPTERPRSLSQETDHVRRLRQSLNSQYMLTNVAEDVAHAYDGELSRMSLNSVMSDRSVVSGSSFDSDESPSSRSRKGRRDRTPERRHRKISVSDMTIEELKEHNERVERHFSRTSLTVNLSTSQKLVDSAQGSAKKLSLSVELSSASKKNKVDRMDRFLNLDDECDFKSNKAQSFRVGKVIKLKDGKEEIEEIHHHSKKVEDRNKSIRNLFKKSSGRNKDSNRKISDKEVLLEGEGMSEVSSSSEKSAGEDKPVHDIVGATIEFKMDQEGAATIAQVEGNMNRMPSDVSSPEGKNKRILQMQTSKDLALFSDINDETVQKAVEQNPVAKRRTVI